MSMIREYRDSQCAVKKIVLIDPDKERPFVSQRVWAILFVLRGLYGRTALMIELSFKKRYYQDWRKDPVTERLRRDGGYQNFLAAPGSPTT